MAELNVHHKSDDLYVINREMQARHRIVERRRRAFMYLKCFIAFCVAAAPSTIFVFVYAETIVDIENRDLRNIVLYTLEAAALFPGLFAAEYVRRKIGAGLKGK